MDYDPNKVYLPDGTEVKQPKTPAERKAARAKRDAAYKVSRERFLAQRKKYKETPMPPADPRPTGTQAGHAVTGRDKHTRTIN